jgi:hypothetical protein
MLMKCPVTLSEQKNSEFRVNVIVTGGRLPEFIGGVFIE